MSGTLNALQMRVLVALASVRPQWTLTGGGALAGFHLRHRTTRDLDLFWHGLRSFAREPDDCVRLLHDAGFQVDVLQRAPAFVRLRTSQGGDAVVVDLVAEPVAPVYSPEPARAHGATIQIDAAPEILANKLGALLHRAELRDLVDVRELLARGGDLVQGLRDAAKKDGGFSPLIVGHLLQGFPLAKLAKVAGLGDGETRALDAFRVELARRIAELATP